MNGEKFTSDRPSITAALQMSIIADGFLRCGHACTEFARSRLAATWGPQLPEALRSGVCLPGRVRCQASIGRCGR